MTECGHDLTKACDRCPAEHLNLLIRLVAAK